MKNMQNIILAAILSGALAAAPLMENGAEELADVSVFWKNADWKNASTAPTAQVPNGFGHYNGGGKSAWGTTDKEAHSGSRSVFMEVTGDAAKANIDLLFAPADGYSGKGALAVKDNAEYYVSFWAKGTMQSLSLRLFQWKGEGRKDRNGNPVIPVALAVSGEWKKFEAKFRAEPGTARIAVGVHAQGSALAEGQIIFIDDVVIREIGNIDAVAAADTIRAAVYDNGKFKVFGHEHIRAALDVVNGVSVRVIDTLSPDTLKDIDVLILSVVDMPSKKDAGDADRGVAGVDWTASLLNFIDSGKGIILGHSAAGYRGMFDAVKVFPDVAVGKGKADWKQTLTVKDASHPVMEGMPPSFMHAYFDHITIAPGPKGNMLAADADGNAAVVAGEMSRGRIVAIGYPMGLATKPESNPKNDDYLAPLTADEKRLLVNAVRWAGSAQKFSVPMEVTATTLGEQVKKYNESLRESQLARFNELPPPRFDETLIWTYIHIGGSPGMSLDTEEKIVTVVENCRKMAFTTILCEAKSGSFFYPSEAYPDEMRINCTNGLDPVGTLAREARKRGMKVALVLQPFKARLDWPKYPPNITKDEAAQISRGELTIDKIDSKHWWAKGNCPDHPSVRERALKITEEIIQRYNPDILYVDYIRYKDSYETSCYCEYSMKQKAEFAKAHPEYTEAQVPEKYAEQSIVSFVAEWNALCKKLNPKIVTTCYTISAPGAKAPSWVNRFQLDRHGKYVSRNLSGPESTLDDAAALTKSYYAWCRQVNTDCLFSPLISAYEKKSPERIYTEYKVVSAALDAVKAPYKVIEWYDYTMIMNKKGDYNSIDNAMIEAIRRANTGK